MAVIDFSQKAYDQLVETVRRVLADELQSLSTQRGFSGAFSLLLGKTTVAHNEGTTEDVSLWYDTTKGEETDTSNTVPVYNRIGDLSEDTWVIVAELQNGLEIINSLCPTQNAKQRITIFGGPTGGTFNLVVTLNDMSQSISIAYNADTTAITTALEGHSQAASGDFTVTNGPFPNASVDVEFIQNFANTSIPLMGSSDTGSLTGGTGVGVIIQHIDYGR